ERTPGVVAVEIVQKPGANVHWEGDEVVAVAAVDEGAAEDAIRAIKVQYQQLPHMVSDAEPPAGAGGPPGPMSQEDIWDATVEMSDEQVAQQIDKSALIFNPTKPTLARLMNSACQVGI